MANRELQLAQLYVALHHIVLAQEKVKTQSTVSTEWMDTTFAPSEGWKIC